jgi:uncharacterized protein (TIGR03435 family)
VDFGSYPLREILMMAFRVEPFRLSAPEWVRDVRVDIQATIPEGVPLQHVPEMLQALLVERFGLAAHVESRPFDTYALVVSPDGIRMREVDAIDERSRVFPLEAGDEPIADNTVSTGFPGAETEQRIIATSSGLRMVTPRSMYVSRMTERRSWQIEAERMSMPELAALLAPRTDRPVIDKTGLTGVYRFMVELPELAGVGLLESLGLTDRNGQPIRRDPSGVSLFRAVESLGLKLEERRTPMDVIVVDSLERRPTDN